VVENNGFFENPNDRSADADTPACIKQAQLDRLVESYFWCTHDRQEIDLVEQRDGQLFGAEMKWSAKASQKAPSAWRRAYPEAGFQVVHADNYLDFIGVNTL